MMFHKKIQQNTGIMIEPLKKKCIWEKNDELGKDSSSGCKL